MRALTEWLQVAAIAGLLSLSVNAQALVATKLPVEQDLSGDHFAAGCPVEVDKLVSGDVFVAGCSVDVDGAVGGDALVAGGKVRLGAPVSQSLYAAGAQVTVNSSVGRNSRIAGGQVTLGSRSQVAGNVVVAGGNVRIEGADKNCGRLSHNAPTSHSALFRASWSAHVSIAIWSCLRALASRSCVSRLGRASAGRSPSRRAKLWRPVTSGSMTATRAWHDCSQTPPDSTGGSVPCATVRPLSITLRESPEHERF